MAARNRDRDFRPEGPEDEFEPDEELFEEDEYVPVIAARDVDEAQDLQALLSDHDIPAILATEAPDDEPPPEAAQGIPILVPQSMLDEAMEVIADRTDRTDFLLNEEDLEEDEEEEDELEGFEEEQAEDDLSYDDEEEEEEEEEEEF